MGEGEGEAEGGGGLKGSGLFHSPALSKKEGEREGGSEGGGGGQYGEVYCQVTVIVRGGGGE